MDNQTDEALVYITSVVAASFAGEDIKDLKEDVVVTVRLADDITSTANITCVSWDFDENGKERNKNIPLHILICRCSVRRPRGLGDRGM